jgi:hypothetical protein
MSVIVLDIAGEAFFEAGLVSLLELVDDTDGDRYPS